MSLKTKIIIKFVEIILFYYDKYYLIGLQKRQESAILEFEITSVNHEETADFLISFK